MLDWKGADISLLLVYYLYVRGIFMRDVVLLVCQECKRKNYSFTKNKKGQSGKLEVKKYCKFDRKHTVHKESKA